MKINLSVPALSTDPVEFVQTNPGTLARDLAALPTDDFLYTGHRLLNDLEQFNRASVDDELRLKLLDVYRVSILNLAKHLRRSIGESELPVSKKLLTLLNIAIELHGHLADGYKRIILNQDFSQETSLSGNILIVSSERAMFSILEIIILSYLSYTPVPENAWKEMHAIFQMAHNKGFTGVKIADNADGKKNVKILDIYLFALLIGLSEPYGLARGGLYALLPYFHFWTGHLSLFDKNNLEGLKYFFRIDPELDKPFLPFPESKPKGQLYLTTDSLVHQMLGPNPPLGIAEEDKEHAPMLRRSLLPKLITSWSNYPIRRYRRNSATGDIDLVSGYADVIDFLRQQQAKQSPAKNKQIQTWQIEDDSATGLGIEYHGHDVKPVSVGDLILYRNKSSSPSVAWMTGIIRRFYHLDRSHVSIGIQRLPPDAQTGRLYKEKDDKKDGYHILMYPENTLLNSEATLITPPGIFKSGMKYLVTLDNGREFQARAIKAKQINPVLEQFTFDYLND